MFKNDCLLILAKKLNFIIPVRILKNFMVKNFLFLKKRLLRSFPDHSKFSWG